MGIIDVNDAAGWLEDRRANSVDHFIFDMPYCLGYARNAFSDKMTPKEAEAWVTGWASDAFRVARDGAWLVTTCTGLTKVFARVAVGLENAGWNTRHMQMAWAHPEGFSPSPRETDGSRKGAYLNPQFDPIILASKGEVKSWMDRLRFLGRTPGTTVVSGYPGCELGPYYEFDRWNPIPLITVQGVEREEVEYGLDDLKLRKVYSSGAYWIDPRRNPHPSIKPIKLMLYLLKLFTEPDDIVVDPFAGTGTTIIACDMLARHGIGVEFEPYFCQIARRRVAAWDQRVSRVMTPKMKRAA